MIALTSRLNERDETIIQLQEELDAYDRIHKDTEQIIEIKQARVLQLEDFIREQCQMEPPTQQHPYLDGAGDDPFYPTQVFSNAGSTTNQQRPASANYRDFTQAEEDPKRFIGDGGFPQNDKALHIANEKVNELAFLLEHQQQENDHLREQLEFAKNSGSSMDPAKGSHSRFDRVIEEEIENLRGQIELT
jgi:hypothetical protein